MAEPGTSTSQIPHVSILQAQDEGPNSILHVTDSIDRSGVAHQQTQQVKHEMDGIQELHTSQNIQHTPVHTQGHTSTQIPSGTTPTYPLESYKPKAETLDHTPTNSTPPKSNRLVILYDQPRFSHTKQQIEDLHKQPNEVVTVVDSLRDLGSNETVTKEGYSSLNICVEYNDEFEANLKLLSDFIETSASIIKKIPQIAYHIHFDFDKNWSDVSTYERDAYKRFLSVLSTAAASQVHQCSIINKYELNTIYLTDKQDLAKLGQEIQEDCANWPNLKICDYGENFIRFFPGVRFPDSLEVLNIGGGYSLETLSGFKMPPHLKVLIASKGSITSIDNVVFPPTLERLELVDNKIYFLNYVQLPTGLQSLDVSQNRIDNLRGVNFPRSLRSLSLAINPIECIKGVKFPESLEYLDVSYIPNESMTGVKFPDHLQNLNLQQSMTNTRGLKLPPHLISLNLARNGVNSINPLKLPNSIKYLHLGQNNIKTLNKVQFPSCLKELYLGDNLVTTLKNIHFPMTLEVLDMNMDPNWEEHEKYLTTLKDVVFPPNLRVLRLRGHKIKSLESVEFPYNLEELSLAYNDLKIIRNVRLGRNLKVLDLGGNNELMGVDMLLVPDSVTDLYVAEHQVGNLPGYIIERANRRQLTISVTSFY
ncbi:hypothetical protein CAAN3_05S07866 [[Candida] anglica]